ncbi:hypothetical protein ARMGADRAFT_1158373 [Armillaria gallica]|uniref:Peptidase C14 caspase domain-containing protein n=1 Tax=Armillaria gallica TaxID=47427 RepID=A0A2H3ELH4_ARMGA|nr:hypothetical protein ARMGADRAFT_1158373 [Armillaria gallica]
MQHVPDHQPQADSRATTFDQDIPAPAQPDPLKQYLRRLAQTYGLDEGADAIAVLQEAERRAGESSGKRSGGRISFASFREALASLKRPGRLGSAAPVTQQSIPLDSAVPITQQSIPLEPRSLTEGVQCDIGRYRFWAVLIGIDAYTQDPLRGCVSDALLMKRFLTDDLGVPENRIQCLLGSKYPNPVDPTSTPSRANIVDTLYGLADNPEICPGDNIIIYYAGHGSKYYCTMHDHESRYDNSCFIEALRPIDRDTKDAGGNWIPDISDRELNSLFTLICCAKGQNITFIADCCHSGGMSRGQQRGIRNTPPSHYTSLEDMLRTADERWKGLRGYQSVLSKDWRPDMDSHVILAACQSYQEAKEVQGNNEFGGVFSKELLRVLRSPKCRKETTYDGLIRLLNLPSDKYDQIPLVDGTRMFEPIFSRTSPRSWAVLIGIDAYYHAEYSPLRGCVSDALLMKRFLTDDLGVPENRIQCLLGSKDPNFADPKSIRPTRANIVDTLYSLANNPEIDPGDKIIIYYAGHCSRYYCTEHHLRSQCDNCPIEALCPIDCDTQDADGNWIPGISDRELNILFALICRTKWHKITFIVDANYSGRISKGQLPVSTMETSTKVESMLHAADKRWEDFPGYRSVLSKDWRPDTDSHVILAACVAVEMDRENGSWYGKFTKALLQVLKSTGWKEEVTYVDLINLLSSKLLYTPLVSGKRMNERLWN